MELKACISSPPRHLINAGCMPRHEEQNAQGAQNILFAPLQCVWNGSPTILLISKFCASTIKCNLFIYVLCRCGLCGMTLATQAGKISQPTDGVSATDQRLVTSGKHHRVIKTLDRWTPRIKCSDMHKTKYSCCSLQSCNVWRKEDYGWFWSNLWQNLCWWSLRTICLLSRNGVLLRP